MLSALYYKYTDWELSAVNEISPVGNLQSFLVDSDGGITLVDTVQTGGSGPTFTNPLSTGEVTAMNVSLEPNLGGAIALNFASSLARPIVPWWPRSPATRSTSSATRLSSRSQ